MTPQESPTLKVEAMERDPGPAVLGAWAELAKLGQALQRSDLIDPVKPAVERFELGIFRLVVMGEIKKGKSSFINALLGEQDLLPTATDVATSTVYKLMYGPERKFKVFFSPDVDSGIRQSPLVIGADELAAYGTETGNPQNRKRVDFIGVELPHPLLKEGLVLVDTPGVGGLFRSHRDITWRYAPNADAIFFVVDSTEAVISADEIKFLQDLTSKVTRRIFFVQTKTDVVDSEQWQSWQRRNRTILQEKLGWKNDEIVYFCASSKMKWIADKNRSGPDLEESGYLAILDFLHRGLMRAKRLLAARDLAKQLQRVNKQLRSDADDRVRISQSTSREELEKLSQEFTEARKHFDEWQRNTYQQEIQRLNRALEDGRRTGMDALQLALSPTGPIVNDILNVLRSQEVDPRKVNESPGEFQQECLAKACEVVNQVHGEFNRGIRQQMLDIARRLADGLQIDITEMSTSSDPNGQHIPVDKSLNMVFSDFENIRTSLYGGMAGGMVAQVGIGILACVFPPAMAIAPIAAIFCSIWGAAEAQNSAAARTREDVLARLERVLQRTMTQIQQKATRQLDETATNLKRITEDLFRKGVEKQHEALAKRLRQIDESRTRSKNQNRQEVERLEPLRTVLSKVDHVLGSVLNTPSPKPKS